MPEYRRAFQPGGIFFFTVVTQDRRRFLCNDRAREFLRIAIRSVQRESPFELPAIVLLPDHLHCIWELPDGDGDFSTRWSRIKRLFTKQWLEIDGLRGEVSLSKKKHREAGVWQRRFWEHMIRDQQDLENHVNYVHFNPVKHGYVDCPHAWPYSSFHGWVKQGTYDAYWKCTCDGRNPEPLQVPMLEGLEME